VYKLIVSDGNTCVTSTKRQLTEDVVPTGKKMKWAIVALTKHGASSTRSRDEALVRLLSRYSNTYDFTIIYFSEITLNPVEIKEWEKIYAGNADVHFIDTSKHGFQGNTNQRYGYKYMCKFFALDIYTHLKDYDYYLRCDTDCKIKTVSYDLFDYVAKNQIEYGYALRKIEAHKPTRETLVPFTEKYLKQCHIKPSALMDSPLNVCFNFYNNFHIGKISFFLRSDVQHYLKAVNDSGGILSDRWGDSTIQAFAVRLFMDPARIQFIPSFSYVHGSHNAFVTTFSNTTRKSNIPQTLPLWRYDGTNNMEYA
jgi:hypothetical protein